MIWLVENTRGFFTTFFCLTTAFPSSLVVSLQHCQQSPKQRPSTEETARTPADLVSALQSAQKRHRWKIQTLKYANYYVLLQISRYGQKKKKNKPNPVPGIRGHGQSPLVDTGEASSLCTTSSSKCDFTQALSACAFLFAYLSVLPVL